MTGIDRKRAGPGRAAAPPWSSDPDICAPRQHVVGVTWEEAMADCACLAETAGGCWPTEAEREFASCGELAAPRAASGDTIPIRRTSLQSGDPSAGCRTSDPH